MVNKTNIPHMVEKRLPRYYKHLCELNTDDILWISSEVLGRRMGVTPSQVRYDFGCVGILGQKGCGYTVANAKERIEYVLGIDRRHHAIVVGAGNLGCALIRNNPFDRSGVSLDAAFDISKQVVGTTLNDIPILAIKELDGYVRKHKVDIAALTVPEEATQELADRLVAAGVRGIWNFTDVNIQTENPNARIENIDLAESLLALACRLNSN